MKINQTYLIRVLLTGLICWILMSSVFLIARNFCRFGMSFAVDNSRNEPDYSFTLTTDILGLHQNDPNTFYRSNIYAYCYRGALQGPDTGLKQLNQFNFVPVNVLVEGSLNPYNRFVFLDQKHKLLVYCKGYGAFNSLSNARMRQFITYIGPQGFSATPDINLGQFDRLMAGSYWNTQLERDFLITYDSKEKCFLRIDPENQTIEAGPPLPPDKNIVPLQIQDITRHKFININWGSPQYIVWHPEGSYQTTKLDKDLIADISHSFPQRDPNALPILTDTGEIYTLNPDTLEITDYVGLLARYDSPRIQTDPYPARPDQLLDWGIMPVFFKNEYRGLATVTIDRSADKMTLAVFDRWGRCLMTYFESLHKNLNTMGYGPLSILGKYLVETLHPPLMTCASFFTSNAFDVDDSFHTLFFIPNSYAALGLYEPEVLPNFIFFVLLLVPALIVAICFASLIARDANRRGLPKSAIRCWIVAALAFGLTAYLTYLFTRPDITLVNCPNCGKNRRPDQTHCHRCDAPWSLPHLVPPSWRVTDS